MIGDPSNGPVLQLREVGVQIDGRTILHDVNWTISPGEHWIVLGPNGGGKSTLLGVVGLQRHPSKGTVTVLGHQLGRVDIRPLRAQVSTSSARFADTLRPAIETLDVVCCGTDGALETWWHKSTPGESERAAELLANVGLSDLTTQEFGTLSSGEKQRCLLARALMPDPSLLLLDEPNAGLDLGGREQLIRTLDELASRQTQSPSAPIRSTVLVTHHVEDIPHCASHLLAVADGRVLAAGPIDETLNSGLLSELFGLTVRLSQEDRRWTARV